MIRNSYQILDCNKNISNFNLLEESNLTTEKKNSIKAELTDYHNNNKFEVIEKNNNITNQDIINNRFIFKKGYYFCSYIYKEDNNYFVSEPEYEFYNNPLCPKNDFTNIVISNTIPLNLNIIGVIYYYKYLSDTDQSQCKSNIFTFVETVVTHTNEEKYIIDIVYFNSLLDNIKYELSYIYYKSINYTSFKKIRVRKTLDYIYLNYKTDDNFERLSNVIENTIYKETNDLILELNKTKKKSTILLNFINITETDPQSLKNILQQIYNNITVKRGCGVNIFSNYLIENTNILSLINKITNNVEVLYKYIKQVENEYILLIDKIYDLNDFAEVIKNVNEFNNYKEIFDELIEKKGDETIEDENTILGLKPLILNLIDIINTDINDLNGNVLLLKKNIGNKILDNNSLITNLFNTVKEYSSYEINVNLLNENTTDNNKIHIFMKLNNNNNSIKVSNDKILDKYKVITIFSTDYNINKLKHLENLISTLELFKLSNTNILHLFNKINDFYDYLDLKDDKPYSTLYDIFYNTLNVNYNEYILNPRKHEELVEEFAKISEDEQITLKQNNYESIFKPLPKNDDSFIEIYKKKNSLLQITESIHVDNYIIHFNNKLELINTNYSTIKSKLEFNEKNITNLCNTYNIVNELNKHINKLINTTMVSVNILTEQRNAKKFENLSVEQQNYIKLFIEINKNIYSVFNKYINQESYYISNSFYNISVKNFTNFINQIKIENDIDEMTTLNIYYSLRNCFNGTETNKTVLDEFIIIVYCFCISMLDEHPINFLRFLFSINKNNIVNQLFNNVLHNKIFLYNEKNTNYIKIISSISDITLSEYILNNNVGNVKTKISNIKNALIEELNKNNLVNIIKKLNIIQYFITNENKHKSIIKNNIVRNKYNDLVVFFRNYDKYKLFNFNNDINNLIKLTNNYKILDTTDKNIDDSTKYCISLGKNNVYECDVCDFSKKSLAKNLNSCPTNLPYNLDFDAKNHLDSNLAFEEDTFRIFSYISEPKKQLIYKRGKILYGIPKPNSEFDIFEWSINKTYKNFTLLHKLDDNEDEAIICKAHDTQATKTLNTVSTDLTILDNNNNEFYLNNFYIKNIISQANLNNPEFRFPNSHPLYIKQENNYSYIYFMEDNIKYYMYLNIKKGKNNYDIVWREETYSSKIPFVKNFAKWRLIRTSDYIENLFDNPRILYNIRSATFFDINEPSKINGLLANNNSCFAYDILLNNYFNQKYDIINNTKFKFRGFNNNYNIAPYIKNEKTIFNNPDILFQFINHRTKQERINNKDIEKTPNDNELKSYKDLIDKYKSLKINLYLIKDPTNETYLYVDSTRNIIEFIPLFEDNLKNNSRKLSKKDFIPENFLWIAQNSVENDKLIKEKVNALETKYNTMIEDSVTNLSNNITSKINKKQIINTVENIRKKLTQTGGNILNINSDNILSINRLIKKLRFIKYNDYKLLLKQLDLIKKNSKQIIQSDITYDTVYNRALLKYNDYITKSTQSIFIYFTKEENKYICNINDILNIIELNFNLKRSDISQPLNLTDIEIIIDNNEYSVSDYVEITPTPDNLNDNIKINISSSINKNISQIFIYINEYELTLNVKKNDVIVYYNKNPLYNRLKKFVIKNTHANKKFNIFNNLNIGKTNKNVYDFSIKLIGNKDKIYDISQKSIYENLTTYNNTIDDFYIKKNKLEDNIEYNSKLFYVSNDRNILYINIYTQDNLLDPIYNVPCKSSSNINANNIFKYICISINNHVRILNGLNKSKIINQVFEYITILYKNNTYNRLDNILVKTEATKSLGYIINTNKSIDLYIDTTILNSEYETDKNKYDTLKIPNKVTLVFDRMINNKYINLNMNYDDFIHLRNLYSIFINIPFTKLETLKNNSTTYIKFINNIKEYITYIHDIQNNTNNENFDNITSILDSNNSFNFLELINYYLNLDKNTDLSGNNKVKLYLYTLFNSNININNYLINLVLTCTSQIQQIYNKYIKKINDLLKTDNRFIDCKYIGIQVIDIIYNFIKYFSDYQNNEEDISFFAINHGFYYKNVDDEYVNYIKKNNELSTINNNIYLISFNDIKQNYSKIYPQLVSSKIYDTTLNKPYNDAFNTYIKEIEYLLDSTLNIKYNNVKISKTIKIRKNNTNEQTKLQEEFNTNNQSGIIDYTNIKFNSFVNDKNIVKGDVILYKFKRNVKTNHLYNTINLLLPFKESNNNWKIFNEFKEITTFNNNINTITNNKLNIYSIANYNELFKTDLIDTYIIQQNLLLKEIIPFKNKKDNRKQNNVCYFKIGEKNTLELHLNQYKYKIKLKNLINSNLYTIYRSINNVNYYLEFVFDDDGYDYKWVKENYNMVDNIINKLLFIDFTRINITETNTTRIEITENDMIMIDYENRFNSIFSHLNKFINNGENVCELYDSYYTIHSKKYDKLIENNNIVTTLDLSLNKSDSGYILKDKYSKINKITGNNKFYLSNNGCNSYIIYNSFKNTILDNNFEFVELDQLSLSLSDILSNLDNYKEYNVNLQYNKEQDMFYELNENCLITKNSNKLKIMNKSINEKIAKYNTYYIYHITNTEINLFEKYKTQVGLNEIVLEEDMSFHIIPINNINQRIIYTKKDNKLNKTDLVLIPIDQHSSNYLIRNVNNEYLKTNSLIDYKKPLRVSLEFVQTNRINADYLFYIKNNVENLENVNIKNSNKVCMIGGQNLILNKNIKKDYIENKIKVFKESNDSKYLDLCNNNTHVNFINYNIETQDDVSYIDCRKKCADDNTCMGFSYQNINGIDKCNTYDNIGKEQSNMLYYDCKKHLTSTKNIGEIKKNNDYYTIDLINNNLYYIKSKLDNKYIEFSRKTSVYNNQNYLKLNTQNSVQDIYNDNIFKFKILKEDFSSGNCDFMSLLTDNKHILGSYIDENKNIIEITYDNSVNKYVWNHIDTGSLKWYLENTNDIYEYVINEGATGTEFYCPFYKTGYRTLKVNTNDKNIITSVVGPEEVVYNKMYNDKNVSIFKNIVNLETTISETNFNNYKGNVFIVKNTSGNANNTYNIFTILGETKYYIYNDTTNTIKIKLLGVNTDTEKNSEAFLWEFEKYNNELSNGFSYQKIIVGGDDLEKEKKDKTQEPLMKGGVKKDELVNNNSYYIKSIDDKYLCANSNYKMTNGSRPNVISIAINSPLALEPNKIRVFNNKFIRASINLSNTKYGVFKNHSIDDDILWKLNIITDGTKTTYRFYNIKHNIYLNLGDTPLDINISTTNSSMYYHLDIDNSNNKLAIDKTENTDMIYNVGAISSSNDPEEGLWTFIKPEQLNNINPYKTNTEFSKLENGKIYRILNQGVKDNNKTETYLTINEMNNELLIPYNDKLFTNNLSNDPTLWKCIINDDNTYSFICMYNNQKLGSLENKYSLLKNVNNKLDFKNKDLSINENYLTNRFYIQHSTNEYYNIINSQNLNYYLSGFSNNKNSYDNYTMDNIKYTHKVANNNEWLLSCLLEEQYSENSIFTDEINYYLYPSQDKTLKYSLSYKYNDIYNIVHYENNAINTIDNKPQVVIEKYKNSFKKYNGFTLDTNVNCNPLNEVELKNYGKDNISIVLTTPDEFYTIRFINYKKNTLLIRINSQKYTKITTSNSKINQLEKNNKSFNKVEYKRTGNKIQIDLNIIAPDIYSDIDLFSGNTNKIHLTYDKEFLNVYVNNKLITFTRILNTLFEDIYFTSNNNTNWNDTSWYKHKLLLDTPLWITENIENFKDNKPGIKFTSKVNPEVSFEALLVQKTIGLCYIKNINNEYLSIKNKNDFIYEVEFIKTLPNNDTNCLWRLYDTNINKVDKIKILDNKKLVNNEFKINKNDLVKITNAPENYYDNIYNSTNVMLKARINKNTKQVDETSNYNYSIIDLENTTSIDEKTCSWLHNKNGHTAIDYNSYLIGSHFTTDLWNYQYILGKDPQVNDTYFVKYKNNKGIIKIDNLLNEKYSEYGIVYTSAKARWENYEEIKEFSTIKSQSNIYIESIDETNPITNNSCISMNEDRTGAICSHVNDRNECYETPNSVLYIPDKTCKDVLYKNYKIINGEKMSGGKINNTKINNIKGGNIWINENYFYLNNKNGDNINFNNTYNVKYLPVFGEKRKNVLDQWTYNNTESKNIILNRIFTTFEYDGYIIDEENKIIRAIILPINFVVFTNKLYVREVYVKGKIKAYNVEYKNIKIIETQDYFNSYDNYYINIKTNLGNEAVSSIDNNNLKNKLNKCYDLIKEGICIPIGNNNTSIGNNIATYDFLLSKYSKFKDNKNSFRIASIYGKYLCDLYVNNTHLCNEINANSLIFQGQFNSINLEKNKEHLIHTTSFESLWKFEYIEDSKSYKITNSHTNKELNDYTNELYPPGPGSKTFYIEYVDNKYFKQQFINQDKSYVKYNNEDLYYIYYKKNGIKYYLAYEDIVINTVYNKSAKLVFNVESKNVMKIPFIIQVANYNLDILTDENKELSKQIINTCYNKIKTCSTYNNNIPLITNNEIRCLNIKYELHKINNGIRSIIYIPNLFSKLVKNNDNFLSLPSGNYELTFILNDIDINNIVYAFSTILGDVKVNIILYEITTDTIENEITNIGMKNIPIMQKLVEYSESINSTKNKLKMKIIMNSEFGIKLNYIELFGKPKINNFKTEEVIDNTVQNSYEPVKINKSLISKKTNIENNIIKIKYIDNTASDLDFNKNIISFEDNNYKPTINDVEGKNIKHMFFMIFNPLLNTYMFYIQDNKFLNINRFTENQNTDINQNASINKYYFKLIESNTIPLSFSYKLYNIQNYDNPNLYVNIKNNNVVFGTVKQDFIFINTDNNLEQQTIIKYNNLVNNNILYTPYIKSIYISGINNNSDKYYYIAQNKLQMDSEIKIKLLIKQKNKTDYEIINTSDYSKVSITNLVNLNDNTYMFTEDNISHEVIITLYNNTNNLSVQKYSTYKKNASFNDINKTLDNTNKYEQALIRNKKYRTTDFILNRIILDNIIGLNSNNKYIVGTVEDNLIFVNNLDENGYFVEINIGTNLCKLWNHKFKKFIKYDIVNNTFNLDNNITEYNDIDLLNDIDTIHIFEKILNTNDNSYIYKLYYTNAETFLNPANVDIQNSYFIENISTLNNFDYNKYDDYCNKMCNSSSYVEDKLIFNKYYNITESTNQLFMTLGKYSIRILEIQKENNKYYKISQDLSDSFESVLLKNFKEYKILYKMFYPNNKTTQEIDINTYEIKMLIVTVNIKDTENNLCNIILWTNGEKTIGRFENEFDKPKISSLYFNTNLDIVYDSNFTKLDFSDNKSYKLSSYTNPPTNLKYIKVNGLTHDIIKNFNISLFHYDNPVDTVTTTKEPIKNRLSNIRKLYTTCSWGSCDNLDNLSQDEITKASKNLSRFEITRKLNGGMLDNDMIRLLKPVNNKNIDFYKNGNTNKTSYVNNNFTYYETNNLLDILFKENDSVEVHKIFGSRGWTNSYNSLYHKTIFMINKSQNIKDIDYYDTFRNIYPVSYLSKTHTFNTENLWKSNNWFEDIPHFRSLPYFKFEEVQITESIATTGLQSLEFVGGRKGRGKIGYSKKNSRNSRNNKNYYTTSMILLVLFICIIVYLKN